MLRMRSRNSAGSSSRALRTSRAKRARRRSDIALPFWGPGGGALRLLSGHARQAHPTQGPRPNAADARLGEAYLTADLAQREPAAVRQDDHAPLAAVPPRGLHEADDTPRDEVLAVVPAAARVERPRRDGPREREVRDDALVARRLRHAPLPAADPRQVPGWCQ